ncbi:MAG TPA: hypothetical protein ENG03_06210, partial [Thioploca sp.]|nr:hypothetical protein [Thioploca sp.]
MVFTNILLISSTVVVVVGIIGYRQRKKTLTKLALSDSPDRPLTKQELAYGFEQLQSLLETRAPVLREDVDKQAKIIKGTLETDTTALSHDAHLERKQALSKINTLCQQASELSFNALALGQTPPDYEARCPFLGLYPFQAQNQEFFFGREALITELQQKLITYHFLAVLGPSGSGKSSLVLAGVVPQMQAQYPELQMAYLTPSYDPVGQLTMAQAKVQDQPTVFVIDQFEELFTLCADEKPRQQFIDQLLSIRLQPVIITMRTDFWDDCAPFEALKTRITARQTLIEPMNTSQLRAAMEQQAAKVGLRFETELSNAILDEIKEEPGAMPLLQHGLQELWKRRHGCWLNQVEYREAFGNIKQAIAKTADDVYYQLTLADQIQFKNIFIRITRLDERAVQGEGHQDTRLRVAMEELVPAGGELLSTQNLVKRLVAARLVIISQNAVTHFEFVTVVHEALIRYWPRLTNWLSENHSNLQLRETIRQAALTWEKNGKTTDNLIHKELHLEEAKVLNRQTGFLNQLETDYVNACVDLAEAAISASKKRDITFASLTESMIIVLNLATFAF